jgi:integrase/recombinase XerD
MANLKYVLRTNKMRDDGTCPIFLRITAYRQVGYISTKIYIKPEQWDKDKRRVKRNNASCGEYNKRLTDIYNKVYRVSDDDKTVGEIQAASHGNGKNDFVEYAEGVIESVRKDGKYWNGKNLETALNKLIAFNKSETILFRNITPEYIRKFRGHLRTIGNKQNTIVKTLGSIKRIFIHAEKEGKIKLDEIPFRNEILRKAKTSKRKLTDEEIDRIVNLELPVNSLIWHVRNFFMFSFFSGGMRFIDLAHLKWDNINNGTLTYTMSKTENTENKTDLEFELLPPAAKILEYYEPRETGKFIFPLLPDGIERSNIVTQKKTLSAKNALVNKYLVKIQERAGIWRREIKIKNEKTGKIETKLLNDPRLSMHISRHSFAYYAMRNGMDLFEIQQMLGHSSAVITQTYLKSLTPKSISTKLKTTFKKFYIPGDKKVLDLAN